MVRLSAHNETLVRQVLSPYPPLARLFGSNLNFSYSRLQEKTLNDSIHELIEREIQWTARKSHVFRRQCFTADRLIDGMRSIASEPPRTAKFCEYLIQDLVHDLQILYALYLHQCRADNAVKGSGGGGNHVWCNCRGFTGYVTFSFISSGSVWILDFLTTYAYSLGS